MEFWGVEVKPGQSLKCQPELFKLIHISQASLGEFKEGKAPKNVALKLKVDDKEFVIGSLAGEERSQLMFDLVFEKEFELSHGWKNGSVFFLGYVADDQASDDDDEFADMPEMSDDELVPAPVPAPENGATKAKVVAAPKKAAAPVKEDKPAVEDSDEDDSDSDDEDDDDSDDLMESSEEEEVPQAQPAKKNAKRPAESPKTDVPAKKNKIEKKGGSPFEAKNSGGKPQQGSNKKPQGGNKSPQGGNKSNGQKQGGNKSGNKGKMSGGQRK